MVDLPTISIVIPTRDRPEELANLLKSILNQVSPPIEVVVVDDSISSSGRSTVHSFNLQFKTNGCSLIFLEGLGRGLTAGRNLGVSVCRGDAVLFLDDDNLLDPITIVTLASFLATNPKAFGVQFVILDPTYNHRTVITEKLRNALFKVLGQNYFDRDNQTVRRSGNSVLPYDVSKVIPAEHLSGCSCYRREVFHHLSFDLNLKRWGFREDIDFSYRLQKRIPGSLWVIPTPKIIHKPSTKARRPTGLRVRAEIVYAFYVFFKDFFDGSVLNLLAFLWSLIGWLGIVFCDLLFGSKPKNIGMCLPYLAMAYLISLKNLRSILMGRLSFFNDTLKET